MLWNYLSSYSPFQEYCNSTELSIVFDAVNWATVVDCLEKNIACENPQQ